MSNLLNIDFNYGDPEPTEAEERKIYVAKVGSFFRDIGINKINGIINNLTRVLINPDLSDDEGRKIKLTINGLALFLDWGEQIINEEAANNLPIEQREDNAFINNEE